MTVRRRACAALGGTAAMVLGLVVLLASSTTATGSVSPRVTSRLAESQILRIAESAAAGSGDPTPTLIQHSEGTRAKANRLTCGCLVPDNRASYLIAERGHFTAYGASPPLGSPLPTGSVLMLVVDASTGEVTDHGVSNNYPDLAALGPVTTDVRVAPNRSRPTLAGNRRAARLDAAKLLRRLRLPPDAIRSSVEPAHDCGWLKPLEALDATSARADVHAWWAVPGDPGSLLAYVKRHPPVGAKTHGTGSGGGPCGSGMQTVQYSWPAIPGVISSRLLSVVVASLPGRRTGILVQAESDWIVPRPVSERVPSGVHEIAITSAALGRPPTVSLTATNAAEVRRISSILDTMPIAQPAAYSCPSLSLADARVITLRFRTGAGGTQLAQATYTDYPPLPSGPCTPIDFTIGGHPQDPLIGGNFVSQLGRILGVSLIPAG